MWPCKHAAHRAQPGVPLFFLSFLNPVETAADVRSASHDRGGFVRVYTPYSKKRPRKEKSLTPTRPPPSCRRVRYFSSIQIRLSLSLSLWFSPLFHRVWGALLGCLCRRRPVPRRPAPDGAAARNLASTLSALPTAGLTRLLLGRRAGSPPSPSPLGSAAFLPSAARAATAAEAHERDFVIVIMDDDKSKVKKDIGASLGPHPRKGGLKFMPKNVKKPAKVVPKNEPIESKDEAIDKELLMKLKTSQINDHAARRVKNEEKYGNSALTKEYMEPWDYANTDYPVSLPLRRPYSGNPENLDNEEFGENPSRAQDAELTAADELGLMDRTNDSRLLFVQLPSYLPLPKQPQSVADPNKGSEERREGTRPTSHCGSNLNELPKGYLGKILVYKSGKVKMKIGDALFDVSSGSNCMFAQEVMAINTREKHFCTVGEISKRTVITPDIDYLLGSVDRMEE
ncbi:hypothetical protein U9M48_032326 [Paspalum notatum var. saurae]|uniref:DNA-directed RNA polymerase III subunit RPC4 n=1 Tax=Paspalum notatum var. saurae TaxID=547442 RepID=A0AAQ3X5M0_PASNO